jgi:quercetin dioxygenase-like cupin family protein
MEDGTEIHARPGQFLFIEPGHRAWVEGDETAVLLDW